MTDPPPVLSYAEPPAASPDRNRMARRSLGYAGFAVLVAGASLLVLSLAPPPPVDWQLPVALSVAVTIVVLLLAGAVVGMIGTDSDPQRLPALLAALLNAALLVGGCLYFGKHL